VKIVLSWTCNHRRSHLTRIRLSHVPRRAQVTTTCRGRGCPLGAAQASARKLGRLTASLDGLTYRAGDRIYITVRAPGHRSERAELVIHDGAIPTAKLV
jgi:hypothetical protein